jgi:hypothetical protein
MPGHTNYIISNVVRTLIFCKSRKPERSETRKREGKKQISRDARNDKNGGWKLEVRGWGGGNSESLSIKSSG